MSKSFGLNVLIEKSSKMMKTHYDWSLNNERKANDAENVENALKKKNRVKWCHDRLAIYVIVIIFQPIT